MPEKRSGTSRSLCTPLSFLRTCLPSLLNWQNCRVTPDISDFIGIFDDVVVSVVEDPASEFSNVAEGRVGYEFDDGEFTVYYTMEGFVVNEVKSAIGVEESLSFER